MHTKKALALANFITLAYEAFGKVYRQEVADKKELDSYKRKYSEDNFVYKYDEFEEELNDNTDEYQKLDTIYAYLICHFELFLNWNPFNKLEEKRIIKQGYEVSFLIKLKSNIEIYTHCISNLCFTDIEGKPNQPLLDFFNDRLSIIDTDGSFETIPQINKSENVGEIKPPIDDRFISENIISECAAIGIDTFSKIGLLNDRMFDFKQWQIRFDIKESASKDFSNKSLFKYSPVYYPNFELLCNNELARLNKKLEIEQIALTHKAFENNSMLSQEDNPSFDFTWTDSGTDLLELVAALYKKGSIQRKDGKITNRTELVKFFCQLFDLQIKDVEGTLSKATGRKMNITPFLDGLKLAFENYGVEKEEKQRKRK